MKSQLLQYFYAKTILEVSNVEMSIQKSKKIARKQIQKKTIFKCLKSKS